MADIVQVNQAGVAVVYSDQAEEGIVQVNAAGIAVVYSFLPPVFRVFPAAPSPRRLQTQGLKRRFPL